METIQEFLSTARNSPNRDPFYVYHQNGCYRIGIGFNRDENTFFIEVLVKNIYGEALADHLIGMGETLAMLQNEGYHAKQEPDNSLYAEKQVEPENAIHELQKVHGLLYR